MILLDVFKYFSKFPLRESVEKAFTAGKSSQSGYAALKTFISGMAEHSLIPEIKGFVIGADQDSVLRQFESMDSVFLFLDYGEIQSSKTQRGSIENTWTLALTIANKLSVDCDTIEFTLNSDQMLSYARDLMVQVEKDQYDKPWLKEIASSYQFVPFNVKERNVYGWTILSRREGADMLNIKNL